MNMYNVITLMYPDAKVLDDFVLQDNGQGTFIAEWNTEKLGTKPTQAELETFAQQKAADMANKDIAIQRREAYPSIQEQLDMMYWDQVDGTRVWLDSIDAVKVRYPKV